VKIDINLHAQSAGSPGAAANYAGGHLRPGSHCASVDRLMELYDRSSALVKLGAWECDLATEQLTWTDGVYDLFDLPRGSAVERASIVELYCRDSRREMERLRSRAITGAGGFSLDICVFTATGRERWMKLTADVERINGRSVRLLGTKQDITEATLAQEKVRNLQAELIYLSRRSAMETMATALAHELNQPLTVICSYAAGARRALRQPILDSDALATALGSIERSALRAGAVIRAMRMVTRDRPLEPKPFDPNSAIRDAVAIALAGNQDVDVRFRLTDSALILMEPTQLQQVIINIIENSVQAARGSSHHKIRVCSRKNGGMLEIHVEDAGSGIGAGMLNWIFNPSESSARNAVGLGLTICRTIVEAYGGRLLAENRGAQGASFGVSIPLVAGL
jgi:C4-dicarboxylate-specific signal transduction histidine kinase